MAKGPVKLNTSIRTKTQKVKLNLINEVKSDLTAVALLYDWLGDSGAVQPLVAELRARRCLFGNEGQPCHLNVAPNWWEEHVKEPIAQWIRGELALKQQMNLSLADEAKLSMCQLCGCCLKLKVWCKTDLLRRHITKKQIEPAPDWCWMKAEIL